MSKTYYLVDFENVNCSGLAGAENLTNNDITIIFFTNNPKVDMCTLSNFNNSNLRLIWVPAGSQSLDMCLASYLGYLIGRGDNDAERYIETTTYIISKDKGFDNVVRFWKDKGIGKIERHASLAESQILQTQPHDTPKEMLKDKLLNGGCVEELADNIMAIINKHANAGSSRKAKTYRNIISVYGQKEGLRLYNIIKYDL